MNGKETMSVVYNSMHQQILKNVYSTTVQVLMDLQILLKDDFEKWRFGRVEC